MVANAYHFCVFVAFPLFYDNLLSRLQIFNDYLDSVRRKDNPKVHKYGFLGSTLLVGIPLPVTGVYRATILT